MLLIFAQSLIKMNNHIYNKYFNSDLAKELRPDGSYLNNRTYFSLTDEDVLCANLFISVFEAGDKFECNYKGFGNNLDITSYVAQKYPQLHSLLPYYCKVYNYYRSYAWKLLAQNGLPRYALVEKFFFWMKQMANNDDYCNEQIYQEIISGCFSLEPFVRNYLHFVKNDNIIILPQSKRIVELKGCSIDEILAERNTPLHQYATNAEIAIFDAVNQTVEEIDKEE